MQMRLYERNGWYYIHFRRGKTKALRTKDFRIAKEIFRNVEREYLNGRLIDLDKVEKMTLSEFSLKYSNSRASLISFETIKKDKLSFRLLIDALGDIQLRTLTRQRLEDFKRICLLRKASPITVNGYLRHVKAALRWALEEELIVKMPVIKMLPKAEEKPRVLEPDEIKSLLRCAFKFNKDLGRRFFSHLYTGARRRELCGLKWQNIDWEKKEIFLTGKGNKKRTVPLLVPVEKILLPVKKDIGPVFDELHPDTVSHRFETIAETATIKARLHDLRHTAATYMLKSGVDLPTVQAILGHANISTTQIYAKVLDETKKQQMSKLKFR